MATIKQESSALLSSTTIATTPSFPRRIGTDPRDGSGSGLSIGDHHDNNDSSMDKPETNPAKWLCFKGSIMAAVVVAVFLFLYVAVFSDFAMVSPSTPTLLPITFWPTTAEPTMAAPAVTNRATRITRFINSIKMSTDTLVVPMSNRAAAGNHTSLEAKALAWLVYDDPKKLSPDTKEKKFRLGQRYALMTLLQQYPNLMAASQNFTSRDEECEWPHVICGEWPFRSHVTEIHAYDERRGWYAGHPPPASTLSPDLSLLERLVKFDVSYAKLTGPLPLSLGSAWSELEVFDVSVNRLTGSVPSTLGVSWTRLQTFSVFHNALNGSLPSNFGSEWSSLEKIDVRANSLTGNNSNFIGNWYNANEIDLAGNNFVGSIPWSFCTRTQDTLKSLTANCDKVFCTCCTACCFEWQGQCEDNLPP